MNKNLVVFLGAFLFILFIFGGVVSASNSKDMTKYSDKEVFLISDKDWRNVLPLIPVTTWTSKDNLECQKGYGIPLLGCVYPTLIYHEEATGFDIDSSIYFMQQYNPKKLTISGGTPQGLDNLLVAEPELGAGLENSQIYRINENDYLSYWESYGDIVYVEEDYELALLASTYASLLNAPLIIENSNLDNTNTFEGKEIICVGNVLPSGAICGEQYNLESLREKYLEKTNTDKIILVNPNDLNMEVEEGFSPDKPSGRIYNLYTKTSLSAPILASAKHELLLSTLEINYNNIDDFLEDEIEDLEIIVKYLTIIASPNAIPYRKYMMSTILGDTIYRSLDQTKYADFNGDFYPEIAVGRIMGISPSDVSSYIARDLFYNNFDKTNNVKFMASSLLADINEAKFMASIFKSVGYNAKSVVSNEKIHNFSPSEWIDQDLISYSGHGAANWAGINSLDIPLLENSLVFANSCLTCSSQFGNSFCTNALRKGSLAFFGAVSDAWSGQNVLKRTISEIYCSYGKSIGQAFKIAYNNPDSDTLSHYYMNMLLGDPTLDISPLHKLNTYQCAVI